MSQGTSPASSRGEEDSDNSIIKRSKPNGWLSLSRFKGSHSCQVCRYRKVKCDRKKPTCGSCLVYLKKPSLRVGTTGFEECVYENEPETDFGSEETLQSITRLVGLIDQSKDTIHKLHSVLSSEKLPTYLNNFQTFNMICSSESPAPSPSKGLEKDEDIVCKVPLIWDTSPEKILNSWPIFNDQLISPIRSARKVSTLLYSREFESNRLQVSQSYGAREADADPNDVLFKLENGAFTTMKNITSFERFCFSKLDKYLSPEIIQSLFCQIPVLDLVQLQNTMKFLSSRYAEFSKKHPDSTASFFQTQNYKSLWLFSVPGFVLIFAFAFLMKHVSELDAKKHELLIFMFQFASQLEIARLNTPTEDLTFPKNISTKMNDSGSLLEFIQPGRTEKYSDEEFYLWGVQFNLVASVFNLVMLMPLKALQHCKTATEQILSYIEFKSLEIKSRELSQSKILLVRYYWFAFRLEILFRNYVSPITVATGLNCDFKPQEKFYIMFFKVNGMEAMLPSCDVSLVVFWFDVELKVSRVQNGIFDKWYASTAKWDFENVVQEVSAVWVKLDEMFKVALEMESKMKSNKALFKASKDVEIEINASKTLAVLPLIYGLVHGMVKEDRENQKLLIKSTEILCQTIHWDCSRDFKYWFYFRLKYLSATVLAAVFLKFGEKLVLKQTVAAALDAIMHLSQKLEPNYAEFAALTKELEFLKLRVEQKVHKRCQN